VVVAATAGVAVNDDDNDDDDGKVNGCAGDDEINSTSLFILIIFLLHY
jgi:hypothetical protein